MESIPTVTFCPVKPYEPFTPCDAAELDPLIARLTSGEPPSVAAAFPRGTLLPDGRLDLCKQSIGPAGALAVLAALRDNRFVNAVLLGADGIGNAGASAVADLIADNPRVQTAFLGCNNIGPDGVRAIIKAVDRGANLRGLWLKRNPIGDEGAMLIADLLERDSSIRTLDLVNTQIGDRGLLRLCEVLAHGNRTIRRVYLGGNGIGSQGAAAIADVIRHSPSLRALLLSGNRFGDAGAKSIAAALEDNQNLEVLGLAACGIGSDGMAALFSSISNHPGLLQVDLGYCPSAPAVGASANVMGDAGVAAAAHAIEVNKVLREIDLRRTSLSPAHVDMLTAAVERNQTLCRLTLAIPLSQQIKARLKRVFDANRRVRPAMLPDPDVQAIRSVYRV